MVFRQAIVALATQPDNSAGLWYGKICAELFCTIQAELYCSIATTNPLRFPTDVLIIHADRIGLRSHYYNRNRARERGD